MAFYILVSLSVLSLLHDYNIRTRHNRNKYKNVALYVAEKLHFVGVGLPCGCWSCLFVVVVVGVGFCFCKMNVPHL